MGKRALCFLTYSNLSQPKLWHKIFNDNKEKLNVYIHNKNEFNDNEFGMHNYCIRNTKSTHYAHISLIKATLQLFKEAFENDENEFFILLSESCIPLYNFQYIYDKIFAINSNIFSSENNNSVERFEYLTDPSFFDRSNFSKQSACLILKRNTLKFFLDNDYTYLFSDTFYAPDEHYFINLCNKFGILYDKRHLNYANWSSGGARPNTYYHLTNEMISDIITENPSCFFMRKIHKDCVLP